MKPALIIGQAQRPETCGTPFIKSHLWKWFAAIGYAPEQIMRLIQFDALVDHGTPKGKKGRVPPTGEQMRLYRPQLIKNIDRQRPKLIIPIGNLAVRAALDQNNILLEEAVGHRFVRQPFGTCKQETLLIPLPHPSGVSLWLNAATNKQRLAAALDFIRTELNQMDDNAS